MEDKKRIVIVGGGAAGMVSRSCFLEAFEGRYVANKIASSLAPQRLRTTPTNSTLH